MERERAIRLRHETRYLFLPVATVYEMGKIMMVLLVRGEQRSKSTRKQGQAHVDVGGANAK